MKNSQIIISLWLISIVTIASGIAGADEKRTDINENSHLIATLKPAISDGFAIWEGYGNPDITYGIEIISRKSVVETIITPKNYYKFDMVTYQNHDFRVKAIDSNSNEVIGVGPQDHITLALPDQASWYPTCTKICNGPYYSWKMQLLQENTPNGTINDPAYLVLGSVYDIFDLTLGAPNLNWEAVSDVVYSNNEQYYVSNNYEVMHVVLPPLPIPASTIHYYDSSGAVVGGLTHFVQKKMRQFAYAAGNRTTLFNPTSSICSSNLTSGGGWIQHFNDSPHPDNLPPSGNDEATLSCVNALTPTGGGGGTSGPGEGGNGAATSAYWVDNINTDTSYLCSATGGTWYFSIVPCNDTNGNGGINWGNGTGGGPQFQTMWGGAKLPVSVDHIELDPLSDKGHKVILGEGGDFTDVNSDLSSLKSGIYQLTVFVEDGRGFPRYVEIVNNTSVGGTRR